MTTRTSTFSSRLLLVMLAGISGRAAGQQGPVTVPDLIGLTTFGSYTPELGYRDIITMSPNGSYAAVVVQRGNLIRNARDFAILLFTTADLLTKTSVDTIARFTSTSNRPAISRLRWLPDNNTLTFLAEPPGGLPQVYTWNARTRTLDQRTHATTDIMSFALNDAGTSVLYIAEPPVDTARLNAMRLKGITVSLTSGVALAERVIEGGDADRYWLWPTTHSAHLITAGRESEIPLPEGQPDIDDCSIGWGEWFYRMNTLTLSPAGDAAILRCRVNHPPTWAAYVSSKYERKLERSWIWTVLDRKSGRAHPLLNSPAVSSYAPTWAADSRTVHLTGELLPLDGVDSATRAARASQTFNADVDVRTGAIRVTSNATTPGAAPHSGPRLRVEEEINTPWRLVAVDSVSGRRRVVDDPNASLARSRRLARVSPIYWSAPSGRRYYATIYWPVGYSEGRRYPLVIQTHGSDSVKFAPSGVSTTGFAAQPLAGNGLIVVQGFACVRDCSPDLRVRGLERFPEAIESLIDSLDQRRLIDRGKIGIQGYSFSGTQVMYFLTRSRYPIAAAIVANCGSGCSFMEYAMYASARPGGEALQQNFKDFYPLARRSSAPRTWIERVFGIAIDSIPSMQLDRVNAPLRLSSGQGELLDTWEMFSGLAMQGKPVEFTYLPDAEHNIIKPSERVTSQQGAVDWFRFWLQGYEDPAPDKREQYARWHRLKERQKAARTPASNR